MNSDAGAIITEYLITTLGNCGHLTKYVITHGLALWFLLGGTCLQGHVVFLRHPKSRDATRGTGTIKSTADCEQTVQIYLLLLLLWPVPVPISSCSPWTSSLILGLNSWHLPHVTCCFDLDLMLSSLTMLSWILALCSSSVSVS